MSDNHEQEYLGEPWTTLTEMRLRSDSPKQMILSFITNEAGALLLLKGIVTADIKRQCKEALEWCCTEERVAPHERSLFDEMHESSETTGA